MQSKKVSQPSTPQAGLLKVALSIEKNNSRPIHTPKQKSGSTNSKKKANPLTMTKTNKENQSFLKNYSTIARQANCGRKKSKSFVVENVQRKGEQKTEKKQEQECQSTMDTFMLMKDETSQKRMRKQIDSKNFESQLEEDDQDEVLRRICGMQASCRDENLVNQDFQMENEVLESIDLLEPNYESYSNSPEYHCRKAKIAQMESSLQYLEQENLQEEPSNVRLTKTDNFTFQPGLQYEMNKRSDSFPKSRPVSEMQSRSSGLCNSKRKSRTQRQKERQFLVSPDFSPIPEDSAEELFTIYIKQSQSEIPVSLLCEEKTTLEVKFQRTMKTLGGLKENQAKNAVMGACNPLDLRDSIKEEWQITENQEGEIKDVQTQRYNFSDGGLSSYIMKQKFIQQRARENEAQKKERYFVSKASFLCQC